MSIFETLNIAALLVISATNAWIALQVKAQQTTVMATPVVNVEVPEAQIIVSTVHTLDYDKLAEALAKQPAPVITILQQPAVIPNLPSIPQPYPNYPYVWSGTDSAGSLTVDGGDSYTINAEDEPSNVFEINGTPVRRFPAR